MTIGGSGFAVLLYFGKLSDDGRPFRLAYMKNEGRRTWRNGKPFYYAKGDEEFTFYDLWNGPIWEKIIGDGDPLEALKKGFLDGSIKMHKLLRTPSGKRRVYEYDMTTATIQVVDNGEEDVDINGKKMPRRLRMEGPEMLKMPGQEAQYPLTKKLIEEKDS